MKTTKEILYAAKKAVPMLAKVGEDMINQALILAAEQLMLEKDSILAANLEDMKKAKGRISDVMLDRLMLDENRISAMAEGVKNVSALESPLGRILSETVRENGLLIRKVSVSMGVLAIIYESRPNVTSDAAALALKSGNVCILRAGKEAYNSAYAIVAAIRRGITAAGLPEDAVNLIEDTTRESASELMRANGFVDLLIPRGGRGLIDSCIQNATVPCIQTGTGICHIYVDKDADFQKALKIINNAKTGRPSVCNAAETLLVHRDIADSFLPLLKKALVDDRSRDGKIPVELRCDKRAFDIIGGNKAGEADFDTEFLDYILAVGVVDSVDSATEHISLHSTSHSEAVITENPETAKTFTDAVDSAAVYVNASTRFTDGGEFGFGCEMGISTQKLHARGPIGLNELTTYKYIIIGNGQIR